MTNLVMALEAARAEVARLELQQTRARFGCAKAGHTWVHMGGRNCGCYMDASCSVPVYECSQCGDCDYGDSDESRELIEACAKRNE